MLHTTQVALKLKWLFHGAVFLFNRLTPLQPVHCERETRWAQAARPLIGTTTGRRLPASTSGLPHASRAWMRFVLLHARTHGHTLEYARRRWRTVAASGKRNSALGNNVTIFFIIYAIHNYKRVNFDVVLSNSCIKRFNTFSLTSRRRLPFYHPFT